MRTRVQIVTWSIVDLDSGMADGRLEGLMNAGYRIVACAASNGHVIWTLVSRMEDVGGSDALPVTVQQPIPRGRVVSSS